MNTTTSFKKDQNDPALAYGALAVSTKEDSTITGYLLFITKEKLDSFLEIANSPASKQKGLISDSVYTYVGKKEVSEAVSQWVLHKKTFFTNNLN